LALKSLTPTKVFFTRGVGRHREELMSFEAALRDADIEVCNLVPVSSILPPHCKIISRKEGVKLLEDGAITFCVMARFASNEPRRLIAASIGCAVPQDRNMYGYLSEWHGCGRTDKEAGEYVEDMAAAMLATTLGVEYDEDMAWDEKKEVFRISGKIVRTREITQSAVVRGRDWHTVVACAIFLFD